MDTSSSTAEVLEPVSRTSALAPLSTSAAIISRPLVDQIEMHLYSSDLTPADLKALRKAGGTYTECRGDQWIRIVKIPGDGRAIFNRIVLQVKKNDGPNPKHRAILCRGPIELYRGLPLSFPVDARIEVVLEAAERWARKHGGVCSCCGELVSLRYAGSRCGDCRYAHGEYERAAQAAKDAGERYDLAVRCVRAAARGWVAEELAVMNVYEVLSGEEASS